MRLETKLALSCLSPHEIAEIVERHLSERAEAANYAEARVALQRIGAAADNVYVRHALGCLDAPLDDRVAVRRALATLRSWRHFSGA